MNFSDFKKINQDSHLTNKQLKLISGGEGGIGGLVAGSFGVNFSNVTVNAQQTNTNNLGAAAMLSDVQVSFTNVNTTNSSGALGHESVHMVQGRGEVRL
jgi:hypothetical protein